MRVLSGAMHYFRTLPQQWPDRLRKLRAMGLDTVETYVPWNLHEPRPGEFDFSGPLDLEHFLDEAAAAGLWAVVRPGPYICAEFDNGGLPSWLPGPLRCADPGFLEPMDRYFDQVVPLIARHQATRGGRVTMVQVENEYGSYGNDRTYLQHIADGLRDRGIEVPLFTSDGAGDLFLTGGTLPGVQATVNFGGRAGEQFAAFTKHRPQDPLFCMEYWNGWFDHWRDQHIVRDPADAAAGLDDILSRGASVNIYMAVGGTNFGFTAGANADGPYVDGAYQPTVTSYDYDAPIAEDGTLTPKYHAYREVLKNHTALPPLPEEDHPTLPAARLEAVDRLALLDCLDVLSTGTVRSAVPPTFEELGISHGLAVHTTRVSGPRDEPGMPLRAPGLRDRAHVFLDRQPLGVLERDTAEELPELRVPADGADLTLVVESMGRVNYGPLTGERKGITRGVLHERQFLFGWETEPVPLDDISGLPWGRPSALPGPAFLRTHLEVAEPADGYLALFGWGKGHVWINGFHLGRYWQTGPQETLYLPWPLLHRGSNEITVLELDRVPARPLITIEPAPSLGTPRESHSK
ncbi:beta-galactosidase [Kitasatospora cineracea]|uniref:glycoside hydrolase family 35 protein n=1 Tax=Kitasatospora cineracea TaxID=88074 RepID=UPI0033FEECB8